MFAGVPGYTIKEEFVHLLERWNYYNWPPGKSLLLASTDLMPFFQSSLPLDSISTGAFKHFMDRLCYALTPSNSFVLHWRVSEPYVHPGNFCVEISSQHRPLAIRGDQLAILMDAGIYTPSLPGLDSLKGSSHVLARHLIELCPPLLLGGNGRTFSCFVYDPNLPIVPRSPGYRYEIAYPNPAETVQDRFKTHPIRLVKCIVNSDGTVTYQSLFDSAIKDVKIDWVATKMRYSMMVDQSYLHPKQKDVIDKIIEEAETGTDTLCSICHEEIATDTVEEVEICAGCAEILGNSRGKDLEEREAFNREVEVVMQGGDPWVTSQQKS